MGQLLAKAWRVLLDKQMSAPYSLIHEDEFASSIGSIQCGEVIRALTDLGLVTILSPEQLGAVVAGGSAPAFIVFVERGGLRHSVSAVGRDRALPAIQSRHVMGVTPGFISDTEFESLRLAELDALVDGLCSKVGITGDDWNEASGLATNGEYARMTITTLELAITSAKTPGNRPVLMRYLKQVIEQIERCRADIGRSAALMSGARNAAEFYDMLAEAITGDVSGETQRVRRSIPPNVRHEVWRRDAGRCVQCGSQERLELDHIIPHSRGGSDTARNIQLLCEVCNRRKSDQI
jgi:5-methylcytosine-specific restriction endonuclease McrA